MGSTEAQGEREEVSVNKRKREEGEGRDSILKFEEAEDAEVEIISSLRQQPVKQ